MIYKKEIEDIDYKLSFLKKEFPIEYGYLLRVIDESYEKKERELCKVYVQHGTKEN